MNLYKTLLRPMIFSGLKVDPEKAQVQLMELCRRGDASYEKAWMQWFMNRLSQQFSHEENSLRQTIAGLTFENPVGLAAGFDKNGVGSNIWPHLGFGFAELGTVTCLGQPGNPQPRLFRLPEDLAAINRMGFNNLGSEEMAKTLANSRAKRISKSPMGVNLGKSKVTPLEDAAQDYVTSFQRLKTYGDYFVINVSSPNTPGLRSLQAVEQLEPILAGLTEANDVDKPIFLKIAPDLAWEDIQALIQLVQSYQLAGMIATNTTIERQGLKTQTVAATGQAPQDEAGGLSGLPVRDRATEVIRFIATETNGELPIIGVGGIFNTEDAWEKITAGAWLVQVYTGWLYEGPGMVKTILQGLSKKLKEQELGSIQEAIGLDNR